MNRNLTPETAALMTALPKLATRISFALGTIILLIYFASGQHEDWLVVGFFYTVLAVAANLAVLAYMCYCAVSFPQHRKEILIDTATLFINIPIAIFYVWLVFEGFELNLF